MSILRIHKTDAAKALLDRALALYLDEGDYLAACVLAGAAEDVFHGYLVRAGRESETARANTASTASRIAAVLDPSKPRPPQIFIDMMRGAYNWPRHADRASDPDHAELDWQEVAQDCIARACENMLLWLNDYPDRAAEFEQRRARDLRMVKRADELVLGEWVYVDNNPHRVTKISRPGGESSSIYSITLDPVDGGASILSAANADTPFEVRRSTDADR